MLYLHIEAGTRWPTIDVGSEPQLQFVTGLPDLLKTEAKGVILVRGLWYETPGSHDLSFTLNRIMGFPGVLKLWDLYVIFICRCTSILCLFIINTFSCREKPKR